jgi:hypothetical protein
MVLLLGAWISACASAGAQKAYQPQTLDLTADTASPVLESSVHQPLPEQYIWTSAPAGVKVLCFRKSFTVDRAPAAATLYIAGPGRLRVYLNGALLANYTRDETSKTRPSLLALNIASRLKRGGNTLGIEVSQGPYTSGPDVFRLEKLAVKIVPAGLAETAPPLVISDASWKISTARADGWERPGFDDQSWAAVRAIGSIEGDIDNFQWNNDAEMYRWPGYDGISPFLAHLPTQADAVVSAFQGLGHFDNVGSLTRTGSQVATPRALFTVHLPASSVIAEQYPTLVLDFGRESDGRLEVISDSEAPARIALQYGESLDEAVHEPYLGVNEMYIPPHVTVYGPKSAFRFAQLRFLPAQPGAAPNAQVFRFKTIQLDNIYYPVHYAGSFESSDALVNRIWQVGAYTSHLCMQDDIWDAPKRDRGRWMGDLDVSGRVIDTVFADHFLMQDTMDRLRAAAGNPLDNQVNGIAGYSAFWVMGQADYYRHFGDTKYLHAIAGPLLELLEYMRRDLDERNVYVNRLKHWTFVDWSPGFNGDPPESDRGTQFEFYAAFKDGAWLLREAGNVPAADQFDSLAAAMKQAAQQHLLDQRTNTFGDRYQSNAMAIFAGVADPAQTAAIWDRVFSRPSPYMITPYYNFYVITAMAETGHRSDTLKYIRNYWGSMVETGATSFWEAWDPRWPREHYHRSLQADNSSGYFVSLCHGWSSGATAWLTEQVLGILPAAPGFKKVDIRPDLAGLEWARGAEPTPNGLIKVDLKQAGGLSAAIDLPQGVEADVSLPVTKGVATVEVDGKAVSGAVAEDGTRVVVHLDHAGSYKLQSR